MKKIHYLLVVFIGIVLTIGLIIYWVYGNEVTVQSRAPQANNESLVQIANQIANLTDGTIQGKVIGRGITTPQSNNESLVQIANRVVNLTDGTVQLTLSSNSSDIAFINTTALSEGDLLYYDATGEEWDNTQGQISLFGVGTSPALYFGNPTLEDIDEGRESTIIFKGFQSGGEESTLAWMRASHDGAADTQNGQLGFYLNDGDDDDSPSFMLEISSDGIMTDRFLGSDTNTFLGIGAGSSTLSHGSGDEGWYNVVSGYNAGNSLTTGSKNLIQGAKAGFSLTTGNYNAFQGFQAGQLLTIGDYNVFQGFWAGNALTTGSKNLIQGAKAGFSLTTGNYNVFQGYQAGQLLTTGDYNVFQGYQAGYNMTNGNKNIIIGYNNDAPSATGNNQIDIADTIFANSSSLNVTVVGGLTLAKVTADPCGDTNAYPEGSIFYNDTGNYWCGCDGTNDIKLSDGNACF